MTIEEMHVTFRELAQQMGMQTVRAILTEDIDICLNASIIAKARSILVENVGTVFSDKIARQNAALSPINSLRSLYQESDIEENNITGEGNEMNPFKITISSNGIMLFTGFHVTYNGNTLYDCRIIETERLGQTLRDFCNRAAKDAPIATVIGDDKNITVKLYTGKNAIKPKKVRYLYIKEPAKVKFDEDSEDNVNCDLPTYLHMEIIEQAVNYYLRSIGIGVKQSNNDN